MLWHKNTLSRIILCTQFGFSTNQSNSMVKNSLNCMYSFSIEKCKNYQFDNIVHFKCFTAGYVSYFTVQTTLILCTEGFKLPPVSVAYYTTIGQIILTGTLFTQIWGKHKLPPFRICIDKNLIVPNSAYTSFCTVKIEHYSERTGKHTWVKGILIARYNKLVWCH